MKHLSFLLLTALITLSSFHFPGTDEGPLLLDGKIGKYPIEMEISGSDWVKGTFTGRYRYKNKSSYLSIKGSVTGPVVFMEEFYGDKTTGEFYLDREGDVLTGKWVAGSKWHDVDLTIRSGDRSHLAAKSLEDSREKTSPAISGVYGVEGYWINDMWFEEGNPALEVGFNGGYAVIEEQNAETIRFKVEMICGPTYHFAMAEGIAMKRGDKYVYDSDPEEEEACVIEISFGERSVKMVATYSSGCGFGARAYLDHELVKISDKVDFAEDKSLDDFKE